MAAYMLMNGIVEKKFLEDVLINEYNLSITKDKINEFAEEAFSLYNKKYYSLIQTDGKSHELLDMLLETRKGFSPIVLDEEEMYEYLELINNITEDLKKSFDYQTADYLLSKLFMFDLSIDEILEHINIPKKDLKKLEKILLKYYPSFRFWSYNGRTAEEFEIYDYILNPAFNEKPKFSDLKTCLENLPKSVYEEILINYDEEDDLETQIINKLKEEVNFYSDYIDEIMYSNHEDINPAIDVDLLSNGFVYLYKENDNVKCFIPDEILNIFIEAYQKDDIFYRCDLIASYIDMNGIIEKEKLKELLKDYHDIDISIKELDKLVNRLEAEIAFNKYYTWIPNLDKEIVDTLLMVHEKNFNKYQRYDEKRDELELEFKDKFSELLQKEFTSFTTAKKVKEALMFGIKEGLICEDYINFIFEEENISASKKTINKILYLYKEYKKYISVWRYNGYSVVDYNKVSNTKTEKIGRNEPCPCGSGKKYKKCCGK